MKGMEIEDGDDKCPFILRPGLGQFNDHVLDNLFFQQRFLKYLVERPVKCYLTTESRVRIWNKEL